MGNAVWFIILLAHLICVIVAFRILGCALNYGSASFLTAVFFIASAIILTNLLSFIAIKKLFHLHERRKYKEYYFHQLRICNEQMEEWEEEMLKVSQLKRNIKNHLIYLREKIELEEKENILDYLDQLITEQNTDYPTWVKSSNTVVNAIVNNKNSIAKKYQIDFQIDVAIPYKLPYSDGDICIILGNAIDNAIEATKKVEVGKRYINLEMGAIKNVLTLVIKNSYHDVTSNHSHKDYSALKMSSRNYGPGLSSIHIAVERYNGEVLLERDDQEFILTAILYAEDPG